MNHTSIYKFPVIGKLKMDRNNSPFSVPYIREKKWHQEKGHPGEQRRECETQLPGQSRWSGHKTSVWLVQAQSGVQFDLPYSYEESALHISKDKRGKERRRPASTPVLRTKSPYDAAHCQRYLNFYVLWNIRDSVDRCIKVTRYGHFVIKGNSIFTSELLLGDIYSRN